MAAGEINWPPDNGLTCGSRVEQDALAEEVKAGAAEHLPFEHLDSVGLSFDHARAPGQGEAGDHGVEIALDTCGEGVEPGRSGPLSWWRRGRR